jgi:hypothetical protein
MGGVGGIWVMRDAWCVLRIAYCVIGWGEGLAVGGGVLRVA